MSTLPDLLIDDNPALGVAHAHTHESADMGLCLAVAFVQKLGLRAQLARIPMQDTRKYAKTTNADIMMQLIFQKLAGYANDSAANEFAKNKVVIAMGLGRVSQPSISRFWDRITPVSLKALRQINLNLLARFRQQENRQGALIDLDSTHSDTYGKQEGTAFNPHYAAISYHPLVMFDGATADFMNAQLRPGNHYTSRGVVDFVRPVLKRYQHELPVTAALIRGDSGFAVPQLFQLCEDEPANYVIKLKKNNVLNQLATQHDPHHTDVREDTEVVYYEMRYGAQSWPHQRRVCVEAKRPAGELLFHHTYIVTNFSAAILPREVFRIYRQRGEMENQIKEAKNGFFMDKTNSSQFIKNEARLLVAMLAYNIVNLMRRQCFPGKAKRFRIGIIRNLLFKLAGHLSRHAGKTTLKLAAHQVGQALFDRIYLRIHRLVVWY